MGDILDKGEADDRRKTKHLRDNVVAHDSAHHDRDDERRIERLVDLLKSKHDASKGRMERRGHPRTCSASDEQTLLSPSAFEDSRYGFARHTAQLH